MADQEPWFKDGLRFNCTQCGNCCQTTDTDPTASLEIRYTEKERDNIAQLLGISVAQFNALYAKRVSGGVSLRSKPCEGGGQSCTMLGNDNRCTIYEARPGQCRTWPFWPENLESPEAWEEAKIADDGCPGMNTGNFVPLSAILKQRERQLLNNEETGSS